MDSESSKSGKGEEQRTRSPREEIIYQQILRAKQLAINSGCYYIKDLKSKL